MGHNVWIPRAQKFPGAQFKHEVCLSFAKVPEGHAMHREASF